MDVATVGYERADQEPFWGGARSTPQGSQLNDYGEVFASLRGTLLTGVAPSMRRLNGENARRRVRFSNHLQISWPVFHILTCIKFAVRARLSPLFDVFRRIRIPPSPPSVRRFVTETPTSSASASQCLGCGTRFPDWISEEYGSLTPSDERTLDFATCASAGCTCLAYTSRVRVGR